MTDKQPEALRLADALTKHLGGNTATQAAAELRRLYELNEDLYQQGMGFITRIAELEQVGRQALEALESVLCDPEGRCCIRGTAADRAVVDGALTALREQLGSKQ